MTPYRQAGKMFAVRNGVNPLKAQTASFIVAVRGSSRSAPRITSIASAPLRSQARQFQSQVSSSSSSSRTIGQEARSGFSARRNALAAVAAALFAAGTLYSSAQKLQLEASQPDSNADGAFRLDPATSQPLPTILQTPQTALSTGGARLRLVGLGVRTVSFLRVRVYVAGLYIDEKALAQLENIPAWHGFKADWMLKDKDHSGEELMATLLDRNVSFAIRIVPVRNTDFGHLRDGFTRAIQGRAKLARKANVLSPEADESLSHSLQELKEAFPKASLAKGAALDLIFAPVGDGRLDLTLESEGKVLGKVKAPQTADAGRFGVARQLLLAYLADKDEISAPFKQSVAEGFESIVQGR